VAATRWNSALPRQLPYDIISAKLRRLPESALRVELGIGPLAFTGEKLRFILRRLLFCGGGELFCTFQSRIGFCR